MERRRNPPVPISTKDLEKTYKQLHMDDDEIDLPGNGGHEKTALPNADQKDKEDHPEIPPRCDLLEFQQIECIQTFVELVSDLIITFRDDCYVR